MGTFDRLPLELKLKVLEYVNDYETLTQVSKEWKKIVKCSKRMLQKELDNYFFFFVVWDVQPPRKTVFYFPIVTEEQFLLLKQFETSNSQVAAIEKNKDLSSLLFYSPFGNILFYAQLTETLIRKITEASLSQPRWGWEDRIGEGTNAVFKYCQEIWDRQSWDYESHWVAWSWFKNQPGPKFTTKESMLELLRGEHKILRPLGKYNYKIIMPQNYDKLKELLATTRKKNQEAWPHGGVAKSLFEPRWGGGREEPSGGREELKTKKDFQKETAWGFKKR